MPNQVRHDEKKREAVLLLFFFSFPLLGPDVIGNGLLYFHSPSKRIFNLIGLYIGNAFFQETGIRIFS